MIKRRQFLVVMFSMGWLERLVFAADEANYNVEFSWRVSEAHREIVESSLANNRDISQAQDDEAKGLFIVIFAGVIALPYLAEAILKLRDRLVQPGLKIDARGRKIHIETDSTLPKGYILLVDKSGGRLYPPGDIKNPTEFIEKITAAAK